MYQSQLPPSRLPPTIEFLTMTDEFVFGGRRVAPDGRVHEPELAVGVMEEPAAGARGLVARDRDVLVQGLAVGVAHDAAALAGVLVELPVLGEAQTCGVVHEQRAAHDDAVVGGV